MIRNIFSGVIALAIAGILPALAVELDDRQVEKMVKSSGIFDTKYSACTAEVNGHQVTLKLTRAPKDTEKDCRINSVLVAKAIMERDPAIDLVVVWFHATPEHWWIFQPTRATIGAYGTGQISEQQLLRMVPMSLHVEARSLDTLVANSVGPGPYASERLYLLNYINQYSGRQKSMYPPLPTIDTFVPKFAEIEEDARTGKVDEATLASKIDVLKQAMTAEVIRFNNLPAATRDAQIAIYRRRHNLPAEAAQTASHSATRTVQVANSTGRGTAANFPLSLQQFILLSKKYPEYTPNSDYKLELTRRQQAGLRLMQYAESGQRRKDWSDMFSFVEDAAKANDAGTLRPRLRSLETAIGLPSLPVLQK